MQLDDPLGALSGRARFGGLVGESQPMRAVFSALEHAAPAEVTVLLCGEHGTCNDLAAQALHDHSPRASGPCVLLDRRDPELAVLRARARPLSVEAAAAIPP